ncbi:hypothetical protein [Thermocrinis ruber]|uniref:hypothetical protein n=1 Tax=Thermocrinis ruber TaxID=75906 RepID=UPI00146FBB7E|nr:hypothetical protein [Thermocrinis ruber]
MAKKIFKHLLGKNRRPRFEGIALHLDGKVAELEPRKEGKAKAFDYWLKLSTVSCPTLRLPASTREIPSPQA